MIIIFAYHSISKSDYRYAIAPELFEQQLNFIKSQFEIVGLSEVAEIIEHDNIQGRNVAVITFDDGFRDNYINAFPVLKKMGVPATVFLITGLVGSSLETKGGNLPMLTWQEITEMHNSGLIDFQSHTNSHIDLTAAENALVREELIRSKRLLSDKLGKPVDFFAYPKGRANEKTKSIVGEYFSLAFAGNGVITDARVIDKLTLPRVTICNNWGVGKLRLLTSPFYWRLKLLKKKLFS